jgi:hypothetical protein
MRGAERALLRQQKRQPSKMGPPMLSHALLNRGFWEAPRAFLDPTDTLRLPIGKLKAEYVERQPNRVSDDPCRAIAFQKRARSLARYTPLTPEPENPLG